MRKRETLDKYIRKSVWKFDHMVQECFFCYYHERYIENAKDQVRASSLDALICRNVLRKV